MRRARCGRPAVPSIVGSPTALRGGAPVEPSAAATELRARARPNAARTARSAPRSGCAALLAGARHRCASFAAEHREEAAAPPQRDRRPAQFDLRESVDHAAAMPQLQTATCRRAESAENAGDVAVGGEPAAAGAGRSSRTTRSSSREYERVSKVVARKLADNYEKQAQYEEKTGQLAGGGRKSWMRVSDGTPRGCGARAARGRGDAQGQRRPAPRAEVRAEGGRLSTRTRTSRI